MARRDQGVRTIINRGITKKEARRLIQVMEQAPKPLLIHCGSGADRTGLAIRRTGEKQLSIRYSHIASPAAKGWA